MIGVGDVLATMIVAHYAGDYWVQSDRQATKKEHDAGQCLLHVLTYCLTQMLFLWVLTLVTGWQPSMWGVGGALAVTAVTHYVADRREPLRRLATLLGKGGFVERGGLPLLDQAWHLMWLFPAALALVTA
jgi:hypothetical protein